VRGVRRHGKITIKPRCKISTMQKRMIILGQEGEMAAFKKATCKKIVVKIDESMEEKEVKRLRE
jgi:hypothetical protein